MPCFGGYKFSPMAFYGMSGHGISNHLVLHIVNHGSARAAIQPGYAIYSCVESDYCVLVHNQKKKKLNHLKKIQKPPMMVMKILKKMIKTRIKIMQRGKILLTGNQTMNCSDLGLLIKNLSKNMKKSCLIIKKTQMLMIMMGV